MSARTTQQRVLPSRALLGLTFSSLNVRIAILKRTPKPQLSFFKVFSFA